MTSPANANDCYSVIRLGRIEAGLLQRGDEPSSETYAEDMLKLTGMINMWQTQGLKLWLQSDLSVPLVAGQATYTLGVGGSVSMVKPTRVVEGYYLDSSNNRRPLTSMSLDEYTRLSNVVNQGALNSYFVQKNQTQLAVSFWLTPDTQAATGTAHLIIQQQVTNFIALNETMNFPPEWFLALYWGHADNVSGGQPQAIMDRCMSNALRYRTMLEDWDVEDTSTNFVPDQRMMQNTGRFR